MKENFTPEQIKDMAEADEVGELELAGRISQESFAAEQAEDEQEMIKNSIQNLIDFCQNKKDQPLWPNGPTGETYLKGLVRVNPDGSNRGSFVEGLDSFEKTIAFLKDLDFSRVDVSPEIQFQDCKYYQAPVPDGYKAFTGVLTVEECQDKGLEIEINKGAHGDELRVAEQQESLPETDKISIIIDGGMLSTWYPGDFTASNPDPEQKLPVNPDEWNKNWAVKIQLKEKGEQGNEQIVEELKKFGFEINPENIEAVERQQQTRQHPEGYEDIIDAIGDDARLQELMEQKNIKSIIHSEGSSVWDHTKTALEEIEQMDLSESDKKAVKLIMLYHDLGKTIVGQSEKNVTQTQKKLEKGILQQTMIGHAKEGLEDIKKSLDANGVSEKGVDVFMKVIENHMNTSLLTQDPKKTVKLFESFGDTDEERREVVKLLTTVLQVDGNASEHIDLEDGELHYTKNDQKLELDFDSVWDKYEEGKKMIQEERDEKQQKAQQAEFEKSIFGGKISDYVIKERGIKPGPDMGKAMGKIKGIIAQNKDLSPEEIRKIIDQAEI